MEGLRNLTSNACTRFFQIVKIHPIFAFHKEMHMCIIRRYCRYYCLVKSACVCVCVPKCPHCLIVGYNKALEIQPPGVLPGCGGPHFFIKNCNPAAEAPLHHNVTELYKGKHMRPGLNLQIRPNR